MATSQNTIDYILEQIVDAGTVTAKKMFGGYCLYCDSKVVALLCNDQLYIKPTKKGREYIGDCDEQPPYEGAKPYFYISGDQWEDSEWLSKLIRISAAELPLPKNRSKK